MYVRAGIVQNLAPGRDWSELQEVSPTHALQLQLLDPNGPANAAADAAPAAASSGARAAKDGKFALYSSCGLALAVGLAVAVGLLLSAALQGHGGRKPAAPVELALKPRGDQRTYQFSVLANGIQVVNVRDASALTGAFSVAVEAGSYDDPRQLEGLAHFCEHMLFLGTASYPNASGYDDFVSTNGGYLNAYTADETTVYFTELSRNAVAEGLDRFGDFFRAPLFDASFVEKEVHAIDSEHAKNVQDPQWRLSALMYSLASPESPTSSFHTGDMETLYRTPQKEGRSPVDSLRVWFGAHYCPTKMHLVTFGPASLQEQLAQAKTYFGNISAGSEECHGPRRSWAEPGPWPAERLGKWVTVLGTQPQAEILTFFALPDLTKEYLSHPTAYIEYVLTYGGEHSMLTVLRDTLGLITDLSVAAESGSTGTALWVGFSLASRGRQQPELIFDVFFQYLATLQSKGVDLALYESISNVTRLKWDWAQQSNPSDSASKLAERLTRLPPEKLLSGDSLVEVPDPAIVTELLKKLVPLNMNAALVDPDAEELFGTSEVRVLPHYGVKHTVTDVTARFPGAVQRWSSWLGRGGAAEGEEASSELLERLAAAGSRGTAAELIPVPPGHIADVPTDMPTEFMDAEKARPKPGDSDSALFGPRPAPLGLEAEAAASGAPEVKAWYRKGWVSSSPQVQVKAVFRPWRTVEQWEMPALDSVRLGLYTALLAQEMAPKMFDHTVAGASYALDVADEGISLDFVGFPALLPRLIGNVLANFSKGVTMSDTSRYARVVRALNETLRSSSKMPVDYAIEDRTLLLSTGSLSREESLAALAEVRPESVVSAARELLAGQALELTALVMGNVGEHGAREAVAAVLRGVPAAEGQEHKGEVLRRAPVVRPGRPVELRKRNPRPGDPNDVVVVSVLFGVSTVESRVLFGLLGQMLRQVAYNELRTNQQLGYVVNAGDVLISNVEAVSTVVQGNALRADALEAAVEQVYLDTMPQYLQDLSATAFESHRSAFKQQLLQPPLGYSEEFEHFWKPISDDGACFGLRDEMLEYLEKTVVTKDLLIHAWRELMFPKAGIRQKVAVKYFAGEVPVRPSKAEAASMWSQRGVPGAGVQVLWKEFDRAVLLDAADSAARKGLAEEGGYFPRDLHCRLASKEQAAAPEVLLLEEARRSLREPGPAGRLARGRGAVPRGSGFILAPVG